MAQSTKILGLRKPEENDYYNQQTEQFENWDKVDSAFEEHRKHYGADFGGNIQDTALKIEGKYYLDLNTNGLFRCIKSGNVTVNSSEYFRDDSHSAIDSRLGGNLLLSDEVFITSETKIVDEVQFTVTVKSYRYDNRIKYETIDIKATDNIVEGISYQILVPTSTEIPAKYWGFGDLSMDSPNSLCVAQTVKSPAILVITCIKKIYCGSGINLKLTYIR